MSYMLAGLLVVIAGLIMYCRELERDNRRLTEALEKRWDYESNIIPPKELVRRCK